MLCKREKEIICPEQIFGKTGQKRNKDDVYMHVGNAELHKPKASSLEKWLEYWQHPSIKSNLHPDDVVQHFTSIRAQTSIDRHTGTALENTYRLTRNLKAGWVFRAPVRFVEPADESVPHCHGSGGSRVATHGDLTDPRAWKGLLSFYLRIDRPNPEQYHASINNRR